MPAPYKKLDISSVSYTHLAANRLIAKLKAEIAVLKQELSEYKSVRSKLRTSDLERENAELRGKVQHYEDVIQRNNLWHFFRPRREDVYKRQGQGDQPVFCSSDQHSHRRCYGRQPHL